MTEPQIGIVTTGIYISPVERELITGNFDPNNELSYPNFRKHYMNDKFKLWYEHLDDAVMIYEDRKCVAILKLGCYALINFKDKLHQEIDDIVPFGREDKWFDKFWYRVRETGNGMGRHCGYY